MWRWGIRLLLAITAFGMLRPGHAQVGAEPWSPVPGGRASDFAPAPWSPPAFGLVPARPGPRQHLPLVYIGEFRIVDWNASASKADERNGIDLRDPADLARFVTDQAMAFDANVITLQEFNSLAYIYLLFQLGSDWDCHHHWFGIDPNFDGVDVRVTCVKGAGLNFRAFRLDTPGLYPVEYNGREWWGYTQLEYLGVTITNVHTRSYWRRVHVSQLHREVTTGIVSGDFNHTDPTRDVWYQTDPEWEPTWYGPYACGGECPAMGHKIDHVLTVEQPFDYDGSVVGEGFPPEGGSNHKMLLTHLRVHRVPEPPRFDPHPIWPR